MSGHSMIRRGVAAAAVVACISGLPLLAGAATASPRVVQLAPASPSGVTLTSGNKAMKVAWSESSGGTINFKATATAPGSAAHSCSTKALSCSITGLSNGVVYVVVVTASSKGQASSPSSPASATVGVLSAPTAVHAVAGVASATVSWAAPKASLAGKPLGFTATASPGGFSCSTARTALSNPARTCEIAGLAPGTSYTVTVVASDAYGAGSPSAAVGVTPA